MEAPAKSGASNASSGAQDRSLCLFYGLLRVNSRLLEMVAGKFIRPVRGARSHAQIRL